MNIISRPSPNFTSGRKSYRPEAIVIHVMEGTLPGTDNWFSNPQSKVSAHYGLGKNGEVHQYIQEKDSAWHAGRVNAPTWNLIKPGGNGQFVNPNFYTFGIEHEGNEQSDWTDSMYETSSELISDLCKRWNIPVDRSHILGHNEIYSLKTCPGFKVDLNRLIDLSKSKFGHLVNFAFVNVTGEVTSISRLNLRRGSPSKSAPIVRAIEKNEKLVYKGFTDQGELVEKNGTNISKWYQTPEGLWFWSGAVSEPKQDGFINYNEAPFEKLSSELRKSKGKGVTVAVLDTGVFQKHPDLSDVFNSSSSLSKDFTGSPNTFNDVNGHGTQVAGLIGARSEDPIGVIGLAPESNIRNIKVLTDKRASVGSFLSKGLKEAISNTQVPDIINLSLSVTVSEYEELKAILISAATKSIVVASAGENESLLAIRDRILSPAICDTVISVGTIDSNFLNQNPNAKFHKRVDYIIPEANLLSCSVKTDQLYQEINRSSMGAAFVSGLLSLIISKHRGGGQNIDINFVKAELDKIAIKFNSDINLKTRCLIKP